MTKSKLVRELLERGDQARRVEQRRRRRRGASPHADGEQVRDRRRLRDVGERALAADQLREAAVRMRPNDVSKLGEREVRFRRRRRGRHGAGPGSTRTPPRRRGRPRRAASRRRRAAGGRPAALGAGRRRAGSCRAADTLPRPPGRARSSTRASRSPWRGRCRSSRCHAPRRRGRCHCRSPCPFPLPCAVALAVRPCRPPLRSASSFFSAS